MNREIIFREQRCILYHAVNVFISAIKLDILIWGNMGTDIHRTAGFGTSVSASFFIPGGCCLVVTQSISVFLRLPAAELSGSEQPSGQREKSRKIILFYEARGDTLCLSEWESSSPAHRNKHHSRNLKQWGRKRTSLSLSHMKTQIHLHFHPAAVA